MKRIMALLIACCILLPMISAYALQINEHALTGVICWPEGTDETSAAYVYYYDYPAAEGNDVTAATINTYYQYLVEDAEAFGVPITAQMMDPADTQAVTNISSKVTYLGDDYVSILVTRTDTGSGLDDSSLSAHTFVLTGDRAGQESSLLWILGLMTDAESASDSWLEARQSQKINDLVQALVWDTIQKDIASGSGQYDPQLDYEIFSMVFAPQEDFYLDSDGNPVFFIQSAYISEAGPLLFPISIDELLDEL